MFTQERTFDHFLAFGLFKTLRVKKRYQPPRQTRYMNSYVGRLGASSDRMDVSRRRRLRPVGYVDSSQPACSQRP